ncbi:MAG: prepilin-type N-terminal cleavage/methylation domain-containing protein [Blastochloris sp.]|nr:prepilin-type N-terminal cleavage/methylation domain-containing protein [Blastochloris sp.]
MRPTSLCPRSERARADAGFTLLETVCVVAIVALLAAIVMPRVSSGTSLARLKAHAIEIASLLKGDRMSAIRHQRMVSAQVDARERIVRSGSNGPTIRLPDDVLVETVLPKRCNGRPALSTISFFESGMSCGGTIALMRFATRFDIRVNWLTGGIEIVGPTVP